MDARTFVAVLALALAGCDSDSGGGDAGGSTGASTATDGMSSGSSGDSDPSTTDDPSTTEGPSTTGEPGTSTSGDGSSSESGGETTGTVDNPCGAPMIASGDPFTIDFGDAGTFEFPGGDAVCQMAGIHTGTWNGADSTAFSFSGMSADPLSDTTLGSELNLTEVRWERSAGLESGQADRFSAGDARAVVIEGGPFGLTNPNGAVTVCLYQVGTMNNINTGETAEFPTPMAFSCN